jgi:hypothetical protein
MAPAAILCGKNPQLGQYMVKNLAPRIDGTFPILSLYTPLARPAMPIEAQ